MRMIPSGVALLLSLGCGSPAASSPSPSPPPAEPSSTDGNDTAEAPEPPPFADLDSCLERWPEGELGTGEDAFEPVVEGQVLPLVFGPQGGWHLTAGIRARNVPQFVSLRLEVEHVGSGLPVGDSSVNVALVSPTGTWACEGEIWGLQGRIDAQLYSAFVDASGLPEDARPYETLCGEEARMRVTLRTPGAEPIELLRREVVVVVERDPNQRDRDGEPVPACTE